METTGSEIAIIGMACRFPGANNLATFWENLCAGVESVRALTDDELRAAGVDPALLADPNYVRAGAVLDQIDQFDAAFFGYTPREAELMDPQQRAFLECSYEALEHAGYDPSRFEQAIGVFGGAKTSSYLLNIFSNPAALGALDITDIGLGNDLANLTTRVSYKLNLRGPSYALHTACSTSLVAVHLACQSLLVDECQMALAGGVSINVPHHTGYLAQHGGILSPDGHCRPFDADANGTLFGNGVGVVALKRLDDALADGDTIYAVIRGSAANNDGAQKASFTAPGVEGQADVIGEALATAEVRPETISYIEAHGTATALGDSIEIRALTRAYRAYTDARQFCGIGSVKSNIGHLDTAAGISSLIKTVLALYHGQLPPSINFHAPNPSIPFADSPFYVVDSLRPWITDGEPRRAGVSSFGFGSTNAHLILEEAPPPAPSDPAALWQILPLSAKSAAALDAQTAQLAAHLAAQPTLNLADIAWTLHCGRPALGQRRALVVRDLADALAVLADPASPRLLSAQPATADAPVAFLFPGQGAQYVGMARDLYDYEPAFRAAVDQCCALLEPHLGLDLRSVLYPPPGQEQAATDQLTQTAITQPALFVVAYALAQLWQAWGVTPAALLGHSLGEYVAATLAGVFTLEDALALVAERGRLMQTLPAGSMLSVALPEAALTPLLPADIDLAAVNGPQQCVVSGPAAAIEGFAATLADRQIEHRRLHTSHAFHSAMLDPIIPVFEARVRRCRLNAPQRPVVSNVTGAWLTAAQAVDPAYWAQQLRQPVRFAAGVQLLLGAEPESVAHILLEAGPGTSLTTLARQQRTGDRAPQAIASLRHPHETTDDRASVRTALARLWLAGAPIEWAALHHGQRRRRIALPTYPFERQRFWIEPQQLGLAQRQLLAGRRAALADWFYVPSWKRVLPPALDLDALADAQQRWLIFADDQPRSAALIDRLTTLGLEPAIVRSGQSYAAHDGLHFTIRPRQPQDYAALLDALAALGRLPTRVLHLWSGAPAPDFATAQDRGFYSLLFLAQALARQEISGVQIDVISSEVCDVTGNEPLDPAKATLNGPCIVTPQEQPNLRCRLIDAPLDAPADAALIDRLLAELAAPNTEPLIALRGAYRWVQTFDPAQQPELETQPRLRQHGVYLITGGQGGIGQVLAEHLARSVQARLALVGRSVFPAHETWDDWLQQHDEDDATSVRIRQLRRLEALGAEILVISADVADPAQVARALAATEARFGALHGVIHAAGLVGERTFSTIGETAEAICEAHFRPKAYGLRALDQALADRPLDFGVLISSLAAVLGGFGAVAYTAANAYLDAFARRPRRGRSWISVNWDAWKLGKDEEQSSYLQQAVSTAILPEEGQEAFRRLLGMSGATQTLISTSDLQARVEQWIRLVGLSDASDSAGGARHARPSLQTSYAAPRNEIEQTVVEIWQQTLGIEQVGIHDNFFELGGHSLLITQLLNKLHRIYGFDLPMRALFEQPTVAGMAAQIEAQRGSAATVPIAEQLRQALPDQQIALLIDYFRATISAALGLAPESLTATGPLDEAELTRITADMMWHFQQDFGLQVYPHEIPQLRSLQELARFTGDELARKASLKQVEQTAPEMPLERYEPFVQAAPNLRRPTASPTRKTRDMIFLHASPRSGSTLMRVMLAGHPQLFSPPELGILWYETMRDWHRSLNDPDYGHGFHWAAQGLQWTFMELLGQNADAAKVLIDQHVARDTPIAEVYAELQQLARPRLLIDKSPSYGMSLETLLHAEELFENARYIHLVRHPYAMIESFLRIRLDKLFSPPIYGAHPVDPYVVAEKVWTTCVGNTRRLQAAVDPARYHLIRYEDLVSDPRATMGRLCAFLDIPFDEAVLQPYDDRRERMITGIGDPNILQHDSVDARLGEAWRSIRLPHWLSQETQRLATELGYELPNEIDLEVAGIDQQRLQELLNAVQDLSEDEVAAMLLSLEGTEGHETR